MSKICKVGYELSDISIVQTPISPIEHRSECNPYRTIAGREMYPVIVSPMASVTDENNYQVWLDNKFMCVIPRSVNINTRVSLINDVFVSFSLDEAENTLLSSTVINRMINRNDKMYICIDIAQGTMSRLYNICKNLKKIYEERIEIMTGNVATPEAYAFYADAGIDYMRCFIGSGSRCTSAANGGTYYPRATLLDELNDARLKWENIHGCIAPTKIIADGGISNFDDIQKCLALGADFVMCGKMFAKSEEACGEVFLDKDNNRYRAYYGMSTKLAQKLTGGNGNKTSEGISKPVVVEYPIAKWADNMKDYLISTMSYSGVYDLDEFKNNAEIIVNYSGDSAYRK